MSGGKEAIIDVKDFTAKYGDVVIIDDISFEVLRGEIFVDTGRLRLRKEHALETHDRPLQTSQREYNN